MAEVVKNSEVLEPMREDLEKRGISVPAKLDMEGLKRLADIVTEMPTTLNSFVETLTNKYVLPRVYSKNFTNPLKKLKRGYLENGDGLEMQFVFDAQVKNFTEHWGDENTPEADLIRKIKPKVEVLYITTNYDKKSKITIMVKDMKKAFYTEGGLQRLINSITTSLQNGLEKMEFKMTKNLIGALISGKKLDTATNAISEEDITAKKQDVKEIEIPNYKTDQKELLEQIRATAGLMEFPSDKYNMAKVENWVNREDLVFITTPDVEAKIDVNTLAYVFNLDKSEIAYSIIHVDEIPVSETKYSGKKILGVLMDKEFLQIWDTWNGGGSFFNPDGQYTNHFANREGIFAGCLYAPAVVFTTTE